VRAIGLDEARYITWAVIVLATFGGMVLIGDDLVKGAHAAWRRYEISVGSQLRWLFDFTPVKKFGIRHALLFVFAVVFGYVMMEELGAVCGAVIGGYYPILALSMRKSKRLARFEMQLEASLLLIATTLKATPNLVDAISTAARNLEAPMSEELDLMLREHRVGATLDEALKNFGRRMKSRYLDIAVIAITIGRATGGDLPGILDRIAGVIRETQRLEGMLDAKTAEGKMQGWFLGAMPIGLGVILYFMDPGWMTPLFRDPLGWIVLVCIAILMGAGIFGVRKVTQFED
jgi:tight adherence protein B